MNGVDAKGKDYVGYEEEDYVEDYAEFGPCKTFFLWEGWDLGVLIVFKAKYVNCKRVWHLPKDDDEE